MNVTEYFHFALSSGVDPIFALDIQIAILHAENECLLSATKKKEFARQRVLKNIDLIAELQKYRDEYDSYNNTWT